MWHLQGHLLYQSIEHRNERDPETRDRITDDVLIPYAHLIYDPRRDDEAAKKIAA